MKEQLIVTLDADLKQEFRIKCITEKKNMTDTIIKLILEYLKQNAPSGATNRR